MLKALAVYGYRSLRDLIVPLHSLNLVTGPNGSGKSNLYRALRLLAEIAQGRAILQLDHADEVVQRDGNGRGARRCASVALANEIEGIRQKGEGRIPEPATRVSAANEPPERSGARGPRERRREGVRGTKSLRTNEDGV